MVDIVRVLEEESRDANTSLDLDDREERDLALAYGFEALDDLPDLALLFVVVRQSPQSLRHRLHFMLFFFLFSSISFSFLSFSRSANMEEIIQRGHHSFIVMMPLLILLLTLENRRDGGSLCHFEKIIIFTHFFKNKIKKFLIIFLIKK